MRKKCTIHSKGLKEMTKIILMLLCSSAMLTVCSVMVFGSSVRLVPPPQEVSWLDKLPLDLAGFKVAIVLGENAEGPEEYGTQLFCSRMNKRFGLDCTVVAETAMPEGIDLTIVAGQRSTNALLDRLCREHAIQLSEESPGHDGYVIEPIEIGDNAIIVVGASNARAVIYGLDTLFQLCAFEVGNVRMILASVRDWPSIPWRGRPQTSLDNFFRPDEWDIYVTARVNFTDLRNGIYAFEPGDDLDREKIHTIIQEAHRRGIIVFGTVNCGVAADEYPRVIELFEQFIDLGVDGLWTSFDDKKWGDDPVEIVSKVVKLAQDNGIPEEYMAVCPSKGGYQKIDDDFNRTVLGVHGIQKAFWFFTYPSGKEQSEQAKEFGMRTNPSWWHNWPRPPSGLTHVGSASLYASGKGRSYMPIPPLAEGWHRPDYDFLSDRGDYLQAIMPWGGNSWGGYYIVPVIAWWGWNPKDHAWEDVRDRIYSIVFGHDQIDLARAFDDGLNKVRTLFRYEINTSELEPLCPARLKEQDSRSTVLKKLSELETVLDRIEQKAHEQTLLTSSEALEEIYLNAMRSEIQKGAILAKLNYPEYWWPKHQRQVLNALYEGDTPKADLLTEKVRAEALEDLQEIGKSLADLSSVEFYVRWWTEHVNLDGAGWLQFLARRKEQFKAYLTEYGSMSNPDLGLETTNAMLDGVHKPPLGWGTGRWEHLNSVLARVLPEDQEQFWGEWMAGTYQDDATEAAAFLTRRRARCEAGGFAELPVRLPVSGQRDRLMLLFHLSSVNKNEIGWDFVDARWANRRFMQLLWEDELLWEADLGLQRTPGQWVHVYLPEIPEKTQDLYLRLRVEDRTDLYGNNNFTTYVGPMWLIELGMPVNSR